MDTMPPASPAPSPAALWGDHHDLVLDALASEARTRLEPGFRALWDDLLLLRAAVETSPVCVSIASMTLPGQPLIFVNEAFTQLTGYSWQDALGRNARFLQGPVTEPAACAAMREAIAAARPAEVTLTNVRRDGTPFRHRLVLQPVFGAGQSLVAYVGHQFAMP